MERKIELVAFPLRQIPTRERVAAYARVSSGKDEMLHSLAAQISYYKSYIQSRPGWMFAGVFADEALTGTRANRAEFQRMLAACRAGQIDRIITKSISRFARNTVTLLQTVRELKELGIDVYFEEQNIHSMSSDGELMLTILASYAQEESRSASENQKWRIRRNFQEGMPWNGTMLGYRYCDGKLIVHPQEAEVVRQIFFSYLSGLGIERIARKLNAEGVESRYHRQWGRTSVSRVLSNYAYTGNLLLQKTYQENHLTKRKCTNRGELPKFHAQNTHEAIIDMATFVAAQEERSRRAAHFVKTPLSQTVYPFTGKLLCMGCGKHYRRKVTATQAVWICSTFDSKGKALCPTSKQVPETVLQMCTARILDLTAFDACVFEAKIKQIQVGENNSLRFIFVDGHYVDTTWQDRSRSESWTSEMRVAAGNKSRQRQQEEKAWRKKT